MYIILRQVFAISVGGVGTFLRAAQESFHIKDDKALLIEGDYVDKEMLVVSRECYHSWNLEKRIQTNRRYDLAICLEVAEHLRPARAKSFVQDVTKISDCILFSAAVPYQGGENHLNEQPLAYWLKLFGEKEYEGIDIIRPQIQYDEEIPFWYGQNTVVLVKHNSDVAKAFLRKAIWLPPLNMIRYDMIKAKMDIYDDVKDEFLFRVWYRIHRYKNSFVGRLRGAERRRRKKR